MAVFSVVMLLVSLALITATIATYIKIFRRLSGRRRVSLQTLMVATAVIAVTLGILRWLGMSGDDADSVVLGGILFLPVLPFAVAIVLGFWSAGEEATNHGRRWPAKRPLDVASILTSDSEPQATDGCTGDENGPVVR